MMFLSFASLASLIYLSQCIPTDMIPPIPEVSFPHYQVQMEGFVKDISIAAENHLRPLMAQLDPSDQQQVVEYGINSFINYIDYVVHMITVNEDKKIAKESEKKTIDFREDSNVTMRFYDDD